MVHMHKMDEHRGSRLLRNQVFSIISIILKPFIFQVYFHRISAWNMTRYTYNRFENSQERHFEICETIKPL